MSDLVPAGDLKEFALGLGFQSVGICGATKPPHIDAYRSWIRKGFHGDMAYLADHLPLKDDPSTLLPGVQCVVACALNYYQPLSHSPGESKIARYALGRDYHKVLRGKLRQLAAWIGKQYPDSKCRACVDSAPIMERDFAQAAGLGFFGKNTMLIDPRRGSWFFIGLLLTTVPFELDSQADGGCGSCRKCIDACPTGALVFEDDRWQLDARRCTSYLTIEKHGDIDPSLQPLMGDWTFGCDVCQEVCPFNQERETQPLRSTATAVQDFAARPWPSLRQIEEMNSEEWNALTEGSAVRRTGLDGLKRNAKINRQNDAISENDSK